jgi:hypothetical protein
VQIILSDHNCEGQIRMIFNAVQYDKDLSWVPMKLLMFSDVGLDYKTDDETLWRYCQEQGYLLVTGNRTGDDGDV